MNARNFRTEKGTELPLLNLKGKQYLEVKYRLVWFREDHPDWSIETEIPMVTESSAYAKATIRDETNRIIATSHKFENAKGFPDFIEKAETGAIGRALALVGYGTQFCADELEDSVAVTAEASAPTPGDFTINFGRKYRGRKLKEIAKPELESYVKWLEGSAVNDGTALSHQVTLLKDAVARL